MYAKQQPLEGRRLGNMKIEMAEIRSAKQFFDSKTLEA